MYQIPSGKGIISKETQRSGKTYYYIRNLPLYCDDQGTVIKFRSKGFTSKEEAEFERKRMLTDRDNGLYKYRFIEAEHLQQLSKKKHLLVPIRAIMTSASITLQKQRMLKPLVNYTWI